MTLRVRTVIVTIVLMLVAVVATAAVLGWSDAQGTGDIEAAIGNHMLAEAKIAAHLVAVAEASGLTTAEINARLREIVNTTVVDEFWISDEEGHAYLRTDPTDFKFSPDPRVQPQASAFWPLLTGERSEYVQAARVREIDSQVFKYAGVAGLDKPRIVQVGVGPQMERPRQPLLSASDGDQTGRFRLPLAGSAAVLLAILGFFGSTLLARSIARPVASLTEAARAIELNRFQPAVIDATSKRSDELGELARAFQRMSQEIAQRERRLALDIEELRMRVEGGELHSPR
jgi:HAMP domain-containing protein/type II secretory pathway pseudopilin PulG